MRKQLILTFLVCLFTSVCNGQKKYEMVIEKTDGTEIVVNTEDVIRTYFRERTGGDNPDYPQNHPTCPDNNHPHMIDLGLPSGTKWACCNVGAAKPDDDGEYYAWGETETKSSYGEYNYLHFNSSDYSYKDLGEICGTQYDVAHVKWGGDWQMPSAVQIQELLSYSTYTWMSLNGVSGGLFTSKKNGRSIFLPAAGGCYENGIDFRGSDGLYFSGTQDPNKDSKAFYLEFTSDNIGQYDGSRDMGRTVRPVCQSGEQPAQSLVGTWEGDIYVSYYFDYYDEYYDASYSQICFLRDPYQYTSGDGYWIDYYDNHGWSHNYIANHIRWTVENNVIKIYFIEDDAYVRIRDFSLDDNYFSGYIELENGNWQRFNLRHVSSPNWGSFYWGYDPQYYYNYYYSNENKVDKVKARNPNRASDPPRRIFGRRD